MKVPGRRIYLYHLSVTFGSNGRRKSPDSCGIQVLESQLRSIIKCAHYVMKPVMLLHEMLTSIPSKTLACTTFFWMTSVSY